MRDQISGHDHSKHTTHSCHFITVTKSKLYYKNQSVDIWLLSGQLPVMLTGFGGKATVRSIIATLLAASQCEAISHDSVSCSGCLSTCTLYLHYFYSIHSFIHFWPAPLWVHSTRRRHHSPECTIRATSIASFRERFNDFRSCWVVFINIVCSKQSKYKIKKYLAYSFPDSPLCLSLVSMSVGGIALSLKSTHVNTPPTVAILCPHRVEPVDHDRHNAISYRLVMWKSPTCYGLATGKLV